MVAIVVTTAVLLVVPDASDSVQVSAAGRPDPALTVTAEPLAVNADAAGTIDPGRRVTVIDKDATLQYEQAVLAAEAEAEAQRQAAAAAEEAAQTAALDDYYRATADSTSTSTSTSSPPAASSASSPAPSSSPPPAPSPPPPPATTPPPSNGGGGGGSLSAKLDALAICESGGNPRAFNPRGYYGAFQFSLATWQGIGRSGDPRDHSYAEQKAAAADLQRRSGWGPWPSCSRQLGYL